MMLELLSRGHKGEHPPTADDSLYPWLSGKTAAVFTRDPISRLHFEFQLAALQPILLPPSPATT